MTVLFQRALGLFHEPRWDRVVAALDDRIRATGSDKDAAFWWGERALNGLFASVFSTGDAWALVEPCVRGRDSTAPRRVDLWFGFGANDADWFTLETKIVWSPAFAPGEVLAKFSEASTQLANLESRFRVGIPLSGCWVVPQVKGNGLSRAEADEVIVAHSTALWTHLAKHEEDDGVLVVGMVPPVSGVHHNGRRAHPGVILALSTRDGLWGGG